MHLVKEAAFSPDNKYFACYVNDKLLVWETLDSDFIECKYDSKVYGTCTSLYWFLQQRTEGSPTKVKKTRKSQSCLLEYHFLAIGTGKGDILLYNVSSKHLYLHLSSRHSDAVNDMCFHNETCSFFTCSNDKSIAIWDIESGTQKSQWKTGDSPATSLCIIDDNNLLSSNTSVLWWNVAEKCIIKEFSGHDTEIFKLLPVNAASLSSCYFLTAAVEDFKIKAWSLNSECQSPVASFVLSEQPVDLDISRISSKDKPLILSTVTKNGFLHLFEHILNGNLNQPIQPKAVIKISPDVTDASVISTKLSPDSESCIIAYGTSKTDMIFKPVKIKESLNKSTIQGTDLNSFPVAKELSKTKGLLINGIKSSSTSENSSNVKLLKDADVESSYRRKLRSSSKLALSAELKTHETEDSCDKSESCTEVDLEDHEELLTVLLKGLKTTDKDILNKVFSNSDTEFIIASVKSLPKNYLKDILVELKDRLQHQYTPTLNKWIKEILRVHVNFLIQCRDTDEVLNYIKAEIRKMEIGETISKLSVLKGFLNLQMQNSSEESDSENEHMEL